MTMAQLVAAYFKFRHVRFENRVARHVPENAGVLATSLQPRHDFGGANVFDEVCFVPTLAYPLSFGEVVRRATVAIGELKVEIVDQTQIAEHLEHKRKGSNCQQSSRLRAGVIVPVHHVKWAGKETAFSPFNFVLARAFPEKGVAIAAQSDKDLLKKSLARRQRFTGRNFENHSVHVDIAGEVEIHAAAVDLRPGLNFVRDHIKDHMLIVIPRDLCVFDPVAIEVAFDAAAAADVCGTVDGILLLDRVSLWLRLRFLLSLRISGFNQSLADQRQSQSRNRSALDKFAA